VTLVADQAMEAARQADRALARGRRAVRCSLRLRGTKICSSPRASHYLRLPHLQGFRAAGKTSLLVERIEHAGAITLSKTNTPEFGAGSQTFNEASARRSTVRHPR
jgi:amidase